MIQRWKLVDDIDTSLDASAQMRADLALLEDAHEHATTSLRLYTWGGPALSLGRFQAETDVDADACRRLGVEVVTRPTGGRALLHGGDLTYAVATPKPAGLDGSVDAIYRWVAAGLIAGLARLGVAAQVATSTGGRGPACFAGQEGADLRVDARKLCGSAQVHRGSAVLQHGAILLRRLPFDETDLLAGDHDRSRLRQVTCTLEELGAPSDPPTVATAIVDGFGTALDVDLMSSPSPVGARFARPPVEVADGR